MASTYSPNLRLELIGTGEQQGTWGSTTNTNLGTLLEEAIGGYVSVAVTDGADTTLTTSNGSADQSRNMVINLTGALTATRNVLCPAIEKLYVVKNATTGGFAVTFKVSGKTGVSIPNGSTYFLYVDGLTGDANLINGTIASQNSNNVSITGGSISGVTVSNTSLSNVSVVANASSLSVRDADASHILSIAVGSNLTANTILTLTTGATSNRTLDISASNVTISTAGAALIDDADASAQRTTLGLGTIATQNANAVSITGGSVTGITDLALADGGTGASLVDPAANAVLGWNDTANVVGFFTAGTGITINATSNTISASGGTSNTQTFNASGTWTKPSGTFNLYRAQLWSGGGSGGKSSGGSGGGAGGGGGGYLEYSGSISDLASTETVTVGLGGTAVTTADTNGNDGGSTSLTLTNISQTITVFGGGGGGLNSSGRNGGGGGSATSAGNNGGSGSPIGLAGGADAGAGGTGGGSTVAGGNGERGAYGGGGGGGTSGTSSFANGAGGGSSFGGGGGGAGAVDSIPGAGAGGTSRFGGNGGAGAFDANNATAGSAPGGGGGGAETGNTGAGGNGRVIVTVW